MNEWLSERVKETERERNWRERKRDIQSVWERERKERRAEITRNESLDDRTDPTWRGRDRSRHGREMSACHWQGRSLVTLCGWPSISSAPLAGIQAGSWKIKSALPQKERKKIKKRERENAWRRALLGSLLPRLSEWPYEWHRKWVVLAIDDASANLNMHVVFSRNIL